MSGRTGPSPLSTIGSTVYACLLPVSDHEARTHVSECRTIQCFILSARAAVSKLDSVVALLSQNGSEGFGANTSDEHSIMEQCCPLADTKRPELLRSGEQNGPPGGVRGGLAGLLASFKPIIQSGR